MVAMARHGLILSHNGAASFRKVFRYLPGLRDAVKKTKMVAKVRKSPNAVFMLRRGLVLTALLT